MSQRWKLKIFHFQPFPLKCCEFHYTVLGSKIDHWSGLRGRRPLIGSLRRLRRLNCPLWGQNWIPLASGEKIGPIWPEIVDLDNEIVDYCRLRLHFSDLQAYSLHFRPFRVDFNFIGLTVRVYSVLWTENGSVSALEPIYPRFARKSSSFADFGEFFSKLKILKIGTNFWAQSAQKR